MKSVSGKEFAKVLERHGWVLLRIQSSHHIYGKQGSNVRLSIPIHGNQALRLSLALGLVVADTSNHELSRLHHD